jgi:hypothetical protein
MHTADPAAGSIAITHIVPSRSNDHLVTAAAPAAATASKLLSHSVKECSVSIPARLIHPCGIPASLQQQQQQQQHRRCSGVARLQEDTTLTSQQCICSRYNSLDTPHAQRAQELPVP